MPKDGQPKTRCCLRDLDRSLIEISQTTFVIWLALAPAQLTRLLVP
jgi:hypothetical protein